MNLIVAGDHTHASRTAADIVARLVRAQPDARLVVATGDTPMQTYAELADIHRRGDLETDRLRIFQLDGYLGLRPDDPRSLYRWMERSFLQPLGIPPERVVRFPDETSDPQRACAAFDTAMDRAGGLDLAILGLGLNGHLGFNEPPSGPDAPTRVVDLTPESIESNARYWGGSDRVPRRAITAGMTVLLSARHVLLLVSGSSKAEILHLTVEGSMTPDIPASYLQGAPAVTIVADRAAAALCSRE